MKKDEDATFPIAISRPGPAPGRALVPPRPNLGPEPWRGPSMFARPSVWLALACLFALALAGLVFVRWRRWRRERTWGDRAAARAGPGAAPVLENGLPTPRDRLLEMAAALREALAKTLGEACRALTIEELAADPELEQRLGAEDRATLISFLELVDPLKFAPESALPNLETLEQTIVHWQTRIDALRERLRRPPPRERGRPSRGQGRLVF